MNRRTIIAGLAAIPTLLGAAPAAVNTAHRRRPARQEVWLRTELYFGTSKPDGEVSDEEFAGFVDREVTSRFPDGLTVLTGYGQFLGSQGLIRERSKVLIIFHPAPGAEASKKIEEIREAYKSAFRQESVLRADAYAGVSF
jgi:hypothetical protein